MYDIVCFDLATETHRIIAFPADFELSCLKCRLLNIFEDRVYLQGRRSERGSGVDLWFLNEEKGSWDKPFRIPIYFSPKQLLKQQFDQVNDHGVVELIGNDFLVSLDGFTDSDSMMIFNNPYRSIPLFKWHESVARLRPRIEPLDILP